MSAIPHHSSDKVCALCEQKLSQAHPDLVRWFHDVKSRHENTHVSWSYRDEASQNQAVSTGASLLPYPQSAHNHTVQGEPLSLALDIFQIDDSGRAVFDPIFCAKVNEESLSLGYALRWGGQFKKLGDHDHFEVICSPESSQSI